MVFCGNINEVGWGIVPHCLTVVKTKGVFLMESSKYFEQLARFVPDMTLGEAKFIAWWDDNPRNLMSGNLFAMCGPDLAEQINALRVVLEQAEPDTFEVESLVCEIRRTLARKNEFHDAGRVGC